MQYDFDEPVDRRDTGSVKWDLYVGHDVLPMWVADMDFRSPPEILAALKRRAEHGVFGYSNPPRRLIDLTIQRMSTLHGWEVEPEWLVWIPGVVPGINLACRAVAGPGDEISTAIPAYYPFLDAPGNSNQQLVTTPLTRDGESWHFDFERFEASLSDRTKMFILCNPYNPVGRVFTRQELERICEICIRHDVVICSDEIHCELILDAELHHLPTAGLDDEVARNTITLHAPSKTFNLPGLNCAVAVIPSPELRRAFRHAARGVVPYHVNVMGFAAAEAAYGECEAWREQLLAYLRRNRDYLEAEIGAMTELRMSHVEATYLAWIDATALEVPDPHSFFEHAGVGMSDGSRFGGDGFVRLNFGCRRTLLEEAVGRIQAALKVRAKQG